LLPHQVRTWRLLSNKTLLGPRTTEISYLTFYTLPRMPIGTAFTQQGQIPKGS
jgi:hypothetical protein